MMMKKRFAIELLSILSCCLAFASTVTAQSTEQLILDSIYQTYDSVPFLSFDVRYQLKSDTLDADSTKVEELTGSYTMSSRRAVFHLGDLECMQNDSFFIAVYHKDKMIIVGEPKRQNAGSFLPMRDALDSLLGVYSTHFTITVDKHQDTTSYIRFVASDTLAVFNKFVIQYNDANKLISKLEYVFYQPTDTTTQVRMFTIEFSNYRFDNLSPSIYDQNNYIWEEEGIFKAVPKYIDYKVFNTVPR